MSFTHLEYMARFNTTTLNIVSQWSLKREQLSVLLYDFPQLLQAYYNSTKMPYPYNPRITLVDKMPTLRLAIICEATVNTLYAMADIAANFANKVSHGKILSKFNALSKKLKKEWRDSELAHVLGDLQWYYKIHEIRTEWTHYSSIFIAENRSGTPLLCIQSYRNPESKQEFPHKFSCTIDDLINWTKNAQQTIDKFGDYLLLEYVIPQAELNRTFRIPIYDQYGWPTITEDHLFPNEEITMAEYMRRGGIHTLLLQSEKPHLHQIGIEIIDLCKQNMNG